MLEKLEKLEKALEKLEERLNLWIVRLQSTLRSLYYTLMPKFILVFFRKVKALSKDKLDSLRFFILKCLNRISLFISRVREKINNVLDFASTYPYKERMFGFLEKVKVLLLKTPLKSHAVFIIESTKRRINHIDTVTDKLGKGQLAFGVAALSVIGLGFYGVINSTNQILLNEFSSRAPASVQEYAYKPEYKDFQKRTIKVLNVKIPIYRESVKDIRSITVDFTVRTNTRFAKQYLEHYENQLRDYFFTNVEPVISSFPIEEEGKLVFKEKITNDLNRFLKENRVEGVVEEVGFTFMVAN